MRLIGFSTIAAAPAALPQPRVQRRMPNSNLLVAETGNRIPLFNQQQAAHCLGLSVRTLERHRVAGTGPRFIRLGRLVKYRECNLAP